MDRHGALFCLNNTASQGRIDAIRREEDGVKEVVRQLRSGLTTLDRYLQTRNFLAADDPGVEKNFLVYSAQINLFRHLVKIYSLKIPGTTFV